MNRFRDAFGLIAIFAVLRSYASAAEVFGESSSTASGIAHAIYLDDTGLGNYNAIGVDIYPDAPAAFLNFDGDGIVGSTFLLPGADATFTNPIPFIPGSEIDWVMVGGFDDGAQGIDYGAGPLGRWIELSAPLFLNNVVLPAGATGIATISLWNTGFEVFSQTVVLGVPEPSTLVLVGVCCLGLLSRRRFES